MNIVYIAHPISGDVRGNIEKILQIVRHINLTEPDVVPFVPYLADLYALHDYVAQERDRGIKNNHALIKSGFITECRLYGNRISVGMADEIRLFHEMDTLILPMTDDTMFSYMNNNY